MKKINLLIYFAAISISVSAQNVGIGTNTPHSSAKLDVTSTNSGMLVPRMNSAQRTAIATPAQGLMVYDTDTNTFWFYNASVWTNLSSSGSSGWSLSGNSGTNPATNFIGTTDNIPFNVRVNNQKAGLIDNNSFNTFWGYQAGNSNTGTTNTGIGYNALFSNIGGVANTANGYLSLFSNTTGGTNTANGYKALYSNTIGVDNVAIGFRPLDQNTTASQNVAIGSNALQLQSYNNSGTVWTSGNVAVGYSALYSNQPTSTSNGINNTAVGSLALNANTIGYDNTGIGVTALYSNTDGYYNTALGRQALFNNNNGAENTASGYKALRTNTSGFFNTAMGGFALYANSNGNNNTAIGDEALYANVAGSYTTAIGVRAMYYANNTSTPYTNYNVAVGYEALSGSGNPGNNTGNYNTAIGYRTLWYNSSGGNNTSTGYAALYNNSTGTGNTAYGWGALYKNETGNANTAVGYGSDVDLPGSNNNTILGSAAHVYGSNDVVIGYGAYTNASNIALLGSTTTTQCGGYANWSNFSDGRFKTRVNEDVKGLDFIMRLRPITYHMDVRAIYKMWGISPYGKEDKNVSRNASMKEENKRQMDKSIANKEAIRMSGFIAQEVEKAAQQSGYDFDGVIKPQHDKDHYRLAYGEFVVPLVKAMQEQQAIIEEQNKMIQLLLKEVQQIKDKLK